MGQADRPAFAAEECRRRLRRGVWAAFNASPDAVLLCQFAERRLFLADEKTKGSARKATGSITMAAKTESAIPSIWPGLRAEGGSTCVIVL